MKTRIQFDDWGFDIDLSNPIDISIPLRFNGPQPNAYGVAEAISQPVRVGELIGDTRLGGSVNFEQYTFIPHCNGTHTECVGHITHERIAVRDCLQDAFVSAWLVSVQTANAAEVSETYAIRMDPNDTVITREALRTAIGSFQATRTEVEMDVVAQGSITALIIRSLPNDKSKLSRRYVNDIPPYLTTEAINFIVEFGFNHLLVDLPSIDRLFDEGRLSNHRIFWDVEQGSFETSESTARENTITELIYVPTEVPDGEYLLNLQIAPFASDAAPSRPILFKLRS